jgi:hypothetical protein
MLSIQVPLFDAFLDHCGPEFLTPQRMNIGHGCR